MSDVRHSSPDCLDTETLAAFLEGRLGSRQREAVEAHLAECEDCYEVWMEATEARVSVESTTAATGAGARRGWLGGLGLVAAGAIAVVWAWPLLRQADTLHEASSVVLSALGERRVTDGRLSQVSWAPRVGPLRGLRPDEASPELQRAVADLRQLARDDRRPETLAAEGVALLALGRVDEAVTSLEAATREARPSADHLSDLSAALLARYEARTLHLDAVQALNAARRSLVETPGHPPALFNLAVAAEALGDRETARLTLEEYLTVDSSSRWAEEARSRLAALGRLEAPDPALDAAGRLWRSDLPDWASATLKGHNAALPTVRDDVKGLGGDSVLHQLTTAVRSSQTWPPHQRACLARAILDSTQWDAAFVDARSEDAARIARRLPQEYRCAGLTPIDLDWRLAIASYDEGNLEQVERLVDRSLRDAERGQHHRVAIRLNLLQALVAVSQGRTSDAEPPVRAALAAARQIGDSALMATASNQLAEVLREQGDIAGAWEATSQTLALAAHVRQPRQRFAMWANAAVSALDDRLSGAGLVMSDALLRHTREWSNPIGVAFGYLQRASAQVRLGLTTEAAASLDAAERATLQIASATVRTEMQAYLDVERLRAGHPVQSTAPATIFQQSGNRLMAVQALLAQGNQAWAQGNRDTAIDAWTQGTALVEQQTSALASWHRMTRLNRTWEVYERLIGAQLDLDAETPLATLERARTQQLRNDLQESGTPRPASLDLAGFTRALGPHDQALVFCSLPNELVVWHLSHTGVTMRRVPGLPRHVLQNAVETFLHTMDAASSHTSTLASDLLSDVGYPSPESTLVIIPDGPLHRLPFAALRPSGDAPLAARLRLVHAASLDDAHAGAAWPRIRDVGIVAVSEPVEGTLVALPFVDREVAQLRRLYGNAVITTGAEAIEGQVLQQLAGNDLVHFSGHAVTDDLAPWRSFLALSGGARLTAETIAAARVRPGATVVLAACESAAGLPLAGDGVFSLARAFRLAGAGTIVGSLTPVRDGPTSSLLMDFHQAIADGHHPIAALSTAQRRAADAGLPPSHWATFVALGPIDAKDS